MKMKSRTFLIFVSIGLIVLGGLMFFVFSPPHPKAPVKTYVVPAVKSQVALSRRDLAISKTTSPTHQSATHQPVDSQRGKQSRAAQHQKILNSEAYQNFTKMQHHEWMDALNRGEIPDVSFQDTFDFLASQGGPSVDFGQEALEMFRQFFPEGEPEDYDVEMAARLREVLASMQGDIEDAAADAIMILGEEPDFGAWMLGRFKGEIGQTVQWFMDEAIVAASIETPPSPPQENAYSETTPIIDVDMATPTISSDLPSAKLGESLDGSAPEISTTAPLSASRITSIRETLSRYGTDEGLLHLLETDEKAVDWLLEQFESLDAIDVWLSKKETDGPLTETRWQGQPSSSSSPTEVAPWERTSK